MNGLEAILIVALATAAGGYASLLANRFVALSRRRDHHEVGAVVFLQLGVVFAVLLAFVFDEAWSQYNEAAQAVDLEVAALHGASMVASTLDPEDARELLRDEVAYVTDVVTIEWPEMAARRRENLPTDERIVQMIRTVALLEQSDRALTQPLSELMSMLADAHQQREVRIFQVSSGIPIPLWVLLIAFAAVLQAFVALAALAWPATAFAFSAVFASAVTSILVIARLLDYPFEGALCLSPDDFVDLVGKLKLLLAAVGG